MHLTIKKLRDSYQLDIESPFNLQVGDKNLNFQCLIKGYGSSRGMVIDADWNKINPLKEKLVEMGFGYSCFDIENSDINGFKELLDDWGVSNA